MLTHIKAFSGFSVHDAVQAKHFYQDVLGLVVEDGGMPGTLFLHVEGGTHILLYAKPNHVPATFTILNFPVQHIAETVSALKSEGVHFESYDDEYLKTDKDHIFRGGGPLIAWFKDPSDNILSIIETK
ncbi:VOC family protein [Mucilaginibacter sp. RS28]|uniref:VOC family protein n=1 Tax=Mucilaginibacter straminoryzae TaxID=2932774 RepID=A0A9X1WZA7_9SPHI|nr:VOC family protein [Mucilaginibacter straminoryzae]MCJ8208284.1 VOC family protein [Mucilaginibacter straminoryzae]